jgi:hypothetical protein
MNALNRPVPKSSPAASTRFAVLKIRLHFPFERSAG